MASSFDESVSASVSYAKGQYRSLVLGELCDEGPFRISCLAAAHAAWRSAKVHRIRESTCGLASSAGHQIQRVTGWESEIMARVERHRKDKTSLRASEEALALLCSCVLRFPWAERQVIDQLRQSIIGMENPLLDGLRVSLEAYTWRS